MADKDSGEFLKEALARYERAEERDRENKLAAYEDLEFRAGAQWPDSLETERDGENRPVLVFNRMPQFVRQVTNDIRLMKPAIKVVAVDDKGDKDTAKVIAGMIRYVENRSDAQVAYNIGMESQVTAGIGHWQVTTEYGSEKTFDQEIRITPIDDGVAVMWDPDSVLPTREDAMWCFQPIDLTRAAFEERFPDKTVLDFDPDGTAPQGWASEDTVRIARYWCKKSVKRRLALLPDGSVEDLTDEPEKEAVLTRLAAAAQPPQQLRVEERAGHKITHCLISSKEVLEPEEDWPGSYIPLVPVIGEEVRIGRKIVRHGIIRYAKDAQRMYNYAQSLQAEAVALQPKAPFLVTELNVQRYEAVWQRANDKPLPYLPFVPDPANGGQAPTRSPPPIASQGLAEMIALAGQDMKDIIGIQDAGLGKQSNETSGRAIMARQREGDVGMYQYADNFSRAVRHTGSILIDLIPKIYDTQRMIRVLGDDAKVDLVPINQRQVDPSTGEEVRINDVTLGAYDVVVSQGPSYTTRREEAKQGMLDLLQASPDAAALIMDLVAEAQDWPLKDKIAERFRTLLPPEIQAREAEEAGVAPQQPQATPPDPVAEAAGVEASAKAEQQIIRVEQEKARLAQMQAEADTAELRRQIVAKELTDMLLAPPEQPANGNGAVRPEKRKAT